MEKDLTTVEDIMKLIRKWKDENGSVFFAGFFAEKSLIRDPELGSKDMKTEVEIEVTPFASGDKDEIQLSLEDLEDLVEGERQRDFGYLDYRKMMEFQQVKLPKGEKKE